ncbi:hypothetical protein JR605_000511 [Listeria monocytogenes serotype 1/2a]|nr:hypothetical protein [Listeria monocytogenes serotype 1/2a]EGO6802897.1 hypothetical protein [Listeria monocytogenes]HBM3436786.1 hypothetical protein [Listeria innocua]EGO6843229.1 hypothetical protein [Listeria monocytogenes]EGO7161639.1 hypothetical protein [Listeria monocytogenes]
MELTYLVKERGKTVYVASTFEEARQFADHLTDKCRWQNDEEHPGYTVLILEFTHGSNPLNEVFIYEYELKIWLKIDFTTFEEERL